MMNKSVSDGDQNFYKTEDSSGMTKELENTGKQDNDDELAEDNITKM